MLLTDDKFMETFVMSDKFCKVSSVYMSVCFTKYFYKVAVVKCL